MKLKAWRNGQSKYLSSTQLSALGASMSSDGVSKLDIFCLSLPLIFLDTMVLEFSMLALTALDLLKHMLNVNMQCKISKHVRSRSSLTLQGRGRQRRVLCYIVHKKCLFCFDFDPPMKANNKREELTVALHKSQHGRVRRSKRWVESACIKTRSKSILTS